MEVGPRNYGNATDRAHDVPDQFTVGVMDCSVFGVENPVGVTS